MRVQIKESRRWVIKIGSALITNDGKGLDIASLEIWAQQIAHLRKRGYEVVVVSSGAVAAGVRRLGWSERPDTIHEQQAAAAVGQSSLIQAWEQAFKKFNLITAQILLDNDDLGNRKRYLNARSTMQTLISLGVIPVVNENDTVVTDEIRFGDNDALAALVANLIEADTLCILTDQQGVYDSDPRQNALAKIIFEKPAGDPELDSMAGTGGSLGRGGMISKIKAARMAARSGANTIIVGGRIENVIDRVSHGETVGTLLYAETEPLAARKAWLAGNLQAKGELVLDDGAVKYLTEKGTSLLPVGVTKVQGDFNRGALVICKSLSGKEIARGLINYSSDEAEQIAGVASAKIESVLGYKDFDELIHRDNLVLM